MVPKSVACKQVPKSVAARLVKERLPPLTKAQLHIDEEAHAVLNWNKVQALRPEYRGTLAGACRNRFQYLRQLKEKKKGTYYIKLGQARDLIARSPAAANIRAQASDDDEEEEEEEEEDLDDEVEVQASSTAARPFASPPRSHRHPSTKTTPMARRVPSNIGSPSSMSVASAATAGRSKGTPRIKAQKYETLEDAIEDAHVHWVLNFEFPEQNGAPSFFVQRTDDIAINTAAGGKEMVDQIRIYINHISDMRDWEKITGTTVCEGQAFLLTIPVMPKFRSNAKDVKALFQNEEDEFRCAQSEANYLASVKSIVKDEKRGLMRCLFVCPDGMVLTADMQNDKRPSTDEENVQINICEMEIDYTAGKGKFQEDYNAICRPAFFIFRVFKEEKKEIESDAESEVSEDDLKRAFGRMKLRAGKQKMDQE
jgi:hypothetical protein